MDSYSLKIILIILFIGSILQFLALYGMIQILEKNFDKTLLELSIIKSNILNWENDLSELKNSQKDLENQFNSLKRDFSNFIEIQSREKITYPTLKELIDFIEEDYTDSLRYLDNFICTDFSNTFIKNFREKGFYSCLLIIDFEENKSHALVQVKTKDRGIVYVEPQDDKIFFNLKEGDNYCDKVDWSCDWVIEKIHHCV